MELISFRDLLSDEGLTLRHSNTFEVPAPKSVPIFPKPSELEGPLSIDMNS